MWLDLEMAIVEELGEQKWEMEKSGYQILTFGTGEEKTPISQRVYELYSSGESLESVASKCAVHKTTVMRVLEKMDVVRAPIGRPRKPGADPKREANRARQAKFRAKRK